MSKPSISQPSAKTYTVVDLVASALEGRIRIPEFQRPLRWQWEDVRRLFDSIVKGYPIGNLLLWKRAAPAGEVKLGGLRIESKAFDEGWWVVDGQQRLTSLANALSDGNTLDERFSLAYDLHEQVFVKPPREEEGHIVPLPVLFDLQRLIRWFTKEHPEAADSLDEASRITRTLREYQIPAYLVDQDDEAILRDIFDRLNAYGKRLNKSEVFTALYPNSRKNNQLTLFQEISEAINSVNFFGLIDDNTIMKSLLARRGEDVTRDIRAEFSDSSRKVSDFQNETIDDFYHNGKLSLLHAVNFLQTDCYVPHFFFLPYRHLLIVLTRFFAHFPEPNSRNRQLLRRWFWRATLAGLGEFDANWNKAARTLNQCITAGSEGDSIKQLLQLNHRSLTTPKLTDFRPHWAEGRIILASLWSLNPRSLLTGQTYDCQQLADAVESDTSLRSVLPRIIRYEPVDHRYMAANRILLLEDDARDDSIIEILTTSRSWLTGQWTAVLNSHALNEGLLNTLTIDKSSFLDQRQALIEQVVKNFVEQMTETHLEDTPPLDSFDLDEMDAERDDVVN